MTGRLIYCCLFLLINSLQLVSQQEYLSQADFAFNQGHYEKAIRLYKLYGNINRDADALSRRGLAYFNYNLIERAVEDFTNAKKLGNTNPLLYFKMGQSKQFLKSFDEASFFYQKYLELSDKNAPYRKLAELELKNCVFSALQNFETLGTLIQSFGDDVNSIYDEIYPIQSPSYGNVFYFSSNRNKTDFDVFAYTLSDDGIWSKNDLKKKPFNNNYQNVALDVDGVNGNALLYAESNTVGLNHQFASFDENGNDIIVTLPKEIFDKAEDITIVNHNVLAFASKHLKGFGGYDIFTINFKDGHWSDPKNLGPAINSSFDDRSPFYSHNLKHLYFSSNRPYCYGGYDIYYCNIAQQKSPTNMGFGINSSGDDLHFNIDDAGHMVTFSSNRKSGSGGFDLYFAFLQDVKNIGVRDSLIFEYLLRPDQAFVTSVASSIDKEVTSSNTTPDKSFEDNAAIEENITSKSNEESTNNDFLESSIKQESPDGEPTIDDKRNLPEVVDNRKVDVVENQEVNDSTKQPSKIVNSDVNKSEAIDDIVEEDEKEDKPTPISDDNIPKKNNDDLIGPVFNEKEIITSESVDNNNKRAIEEKSDEKINDPEDVTSHQVDSKVKVETKEPIFDIEPTQGEKSINDEVVNLPETVEDKKVDELESQVANDSTKQPSEIINSDVNNTKAINDIVKEEKPASIPTTVSDNTSDDNKPSKSNDDPIVITSKEKENVSSINSQENDKSPIVDKVVENKKDPKDPIQKTASLEMNTIDNDVISKTPILEKNPKTWKKFVQPQTLYYEDRQDLIRGENKVKLNQLIIENFDASANIILLAHTDENELGLPEYVQYNTFKRALHVAKYLIENGIDKRRIRIESVANNYPLIKKEISGEKIKSLLAYNKRIDILLYDNNNSVMEDNISQDHSIPNYAFDRRYELYRSIREGVYYSVEIASAQRIFKNAILRLYNDIYIRKDDMDGANKYFIGVYTKKEDAELLKSQLDESSAPYAKIVKFKNGQRVDD